MSKATFNQENEEILAATENAQDNDGAVEDNETMSEEELREQYQKLPLWQHVLLVILFLFGLTAAIMVIDFIVEFFTELIKHMV